MDRYKKRCIVIIYSVKALVLISTMKIYDLGRVAQWVKVLSSELEGSRFETPPGARPSLGTQLCYEVPGDLWVKYVKKI